MNSKFSENRKKYKTLYRFIEIKSFKLCCLFASSSSSSRVKVMHPKRDASEKCIQRRWNKLSFFPLLNPFPSTALFVRALFEIKNEIIY